jgi:hypothetical protein
MENIVSLFFHAWICWLGRGYLSAAPREGNLRERHVTEHAAAQALARCLNSKAIPPSHDADAVDRVHERLGIRLKKVTRSDGHFAGLILLVVPRSNRKGVRGVLRLVIPES